jgi:epsilon-lactone hydrolase
MHRKFDVALETRHGHEVYTMAPRFGAPKSNVMYLNGGANVEDSRRRHWGFIARIVERLGMTFTVPLCPLGPEQRARPVGLSR